MVHLLSRQSNHKFKFIASRRAIVCVKTDKVLTGLHPILNTCFWPKYKKSLALNHCNRPRNGTLMRSFLFKSVSLSGKKTRRGSNSKLEKGRLFGIRIDKQIEVTISVSVKYNLPCKFFYDKVVRNQHAARLPPSVTNAVSRMHIFSKRFWKAVDELQWRPVASQVGVGCKKWNVATRVDVLAMDKEGKEHVIEFKVGYDGYYYKCTEYKMKFPFHEKEDCMYHQHMIQVALANELYKRTYRKGSIQSKKVGEPVVIRITSTNTYIYYVTDWVKIGINTLKDVKIHLADM